MGQSLNIPRIIKDDWKRLDLIVNKIKLHLGRDADVVHASIILSDLVASRLIATDSGKVFESVTDLTNWIVGTGNQVIVTVLAGGKVTLSTPQDTHVDAHMELAGLTIKDSGDNIVFYVDDDEVYYTLPTGELEDIVTGNPFGIWLPFYYTYTV